MAYANRMKTVAVTLLTALLLAGCQATATNPISVVAAAYAPQKPVAKGKSALVMDANTGAVLYAANADAPRYPASLTKLMTLYILFEEIQTTSLSLNTPLVVSPEAAAQPPSRIGLQAGSTITVRDAIRALAVKSSNDVAVVVAEKLSGSEAAFAARMSRKAKSLGLSRTRFGNATGLPDPGNVTTARDMAKLARLIKTRFPRYRSNFRAQSFTYNGRTFDATNELLGTVRGVDGMKTGYIRASGYNLVATANRGRRRLIVVVIGGNSKKARDAEVTALIESFS
ncbi:MAG: D-alanyl-D-alanine carboxypeptidase [Alphaproteobacteria bacterium]|nr:D-alanyl-D-alanine carboxypeptidase [Alphaproteobacteria bacterium]